MYENVCLIVTDPGLRHKGLCGFYKDFHTTWRGFGVVIVAHNHTKTFVKYVVC